MRHSFEFLESRRLLAQSPQLLGEVRRCGDMVPAVESDVAYFVAVEDTECGINNAGAHLWRTNGEPVGTYSLGGERGEDAIGTFFNPAQDERGLVFESNGRAFWSSVDFAGVGNLYASDGSPDSATRVWLTAKQVWDVNGKVFFVPNASFGLPNEVRRIVGDDTVLVEGILATPQEAFELNDAAYFTSDGNIWQTDGTPENTFLRQDLQPNDRSAEIQTQIGDRLLLESTNVEGTREYWSTDGVSTVRLDLEGEVTSVRFSESLLVMPKDGTSGSIQLTDGVSVTNLAEATSNQAIFAAREFSDVLYFLTSTGQLWGTDGTAEGTQMLADVPSNIRSFRVTSDHVVLRDGQDVIRAARSTGAVDRFEISEEDTGYVWLDANDANLISPSSIGDVVIQSTLLNLDDGSLFIGESLSEGTGYWVTDGTIEGTFKASELLATFSDSGSLVENIEPLEADYSQAGDRVYFNHATRDPFEIGVQFELYTFELRQPEILEADINNDGSVGFADFLILSANYSKTDTSVEDGDLDGDGQVTFRDFLVLSNAYGRSRPVNQ